MTRRGRRIRERVSLELSEYCSPGWDTVRRLTANHSEKLRRCADSRTSRIVERDFRIAAGSRARTKPEVIPGGAICVITSCLRLGS
jgi:hypothetical protein